MTLTPTRTLALVLCFAVPLTAAPIIAIAAPRLFDKKADTRRVFRDFIIAGKDLKSRAKLTGSTYRLAFDLTEKQQSWWVEKSTKVVLVDKAKLEKERELSQKGISHLPTLLLIYSLSPFFAYLYIFFTFI